MRYLTPDIFYPLLLIVIPLYLFFRFSCKYLITGFLDVANIQLIYISFGLSGLVGILIKHYNWQLLQITIACFLWLFASFSGGYISKKVSRRNTINFDKNSEFTTSRDALLVDRAALILTSIIWLLYLYPIFASGFLTNATISIDDRYLVLEQNKVLTYFYSALVYAPPILIYRNFKNISTKMFFLYLAPFCLIQFLTLSKSSFLYPLVSYALFRALLVREGKLKPQSIGKEILTITICGTIVFGLFFLIATYLTKSTVNPEDFIFFRLYTSFDALMIFSEMRLDNLPNLSLTQLYLSPYLKVFNLFNQPYNSSNYFLAVEYFGFAKDYAGLLPNNNHIMEIFLSFGLEIRIIICTLFGFIYGFSYWQSTIYMKKGGYFLLPCSFIYATPFGILVDGQGWFIALVSSTILAGFIFLILMIKKSLSYIMRSNAKINLLK